MKRLLTYLFLLASAAVFSQEVPYVDGRLDRPYNPMYRPGGFGGLFLPANFDPEKKTDVNVQAGTSFATNFKGGYAFTSMVAPELRYKVNDRFSIRGGISVSNTDYGNSMVLSPNGWRSYSGNVTQAFVYVSGDYMISPKVILSGTAYKEFSVDHSNPDNAFRPGYDGKGLIMNLRLFPTDNMQIDVGAEIYQGNNPWRGGTYNPFYGPFSRPHW